MTEDECIRSADDERDITSGFGAWSDTGKSDHARKVREQLNVERDQ
jgi:hypothetical protein